MSDKSKEAFKVKNWHGRGRYARACRILQYFAFQYSDKGLTDQLAPRFQELVELSDSISQRRLPEIWSASTADEHTLLPSFRALGGMHVITQLLGMTELYAQLKTMEGPGPPNQFKLYLETPKLDSGVPILARLPVELRDALNNISSTSLRFIATFEHPDLDENQAWIQKAVFTQFGDLDYIVKQVDEHVRVIRDGLAEKLGKMVATDPVTMRQDQDMKWFYENRVLHLTCAQLGTRDGVSESTVKQGLVRVRRFLESLDPKHDEQRTISRLIWVSGPNERYWRRPDSYLPSSFEITEG